MKIRQNLFILMMIGWLTLACSSPPATAAPTPTIDPVARGGEVFGQVCAACHGQNAEGYANELAAPALDHSEHAWHHPDQQIHDWVKNGKLGLGRQMPALGEQLSDEEIDMVITYLHTLWTLEQLDMQQDISSRYRSP